MFIVGRFGSINPLVLLGHLLPKNFMFCCVNNTQTHTQKNHGHDSKGLNGPEKKVTLVLFAVKNDRKRNE